MNIALNYQHGTPLIVTVFNSSVHVDIVNKWIEYHHKVGKLVLIEVQTDIPGVIDYLDDQQDVDMWQIKHIDNKHVVDTELYQPPWDKINQILRDEEFDEAGVIIYIPVDRLLKMLNGASIKTVKCAAENELIAYASLLQTNKIDKILITCRDDIKLNKKLLGKRITPKQKKLFNHEDAAALYPRQRFIGLGAKTNTIALAKSLVTVNNQVADNPADLRTGLRVGLRVGLDVGLRPGLRSGLRAGLRSGLRVGL